ncbi:hypothetical protein CEXT_389791 [Caerostris extrusa]|uniref:Uncharacterized protein n=1 Tax=Caerostris extrusa TaxID=172846 RepID=A0AAV4V8N0_CAEEX|nr:hypothetical protein CEXT_389791 [Caerostris extrusa]
MVNAHGVACLPKPIIMEWYSRSELVKMQIDLGCHPYQIQTTTRRQLMLQLGMNVAYPFRCFQNITSHHSFCSSLHIIRQELIYSKVYGQWIPGN